LATKFFRESFLTPAERAANRQSQTAQNGEEVGSRCPDSLAARAAHGGEASANDNMGLERRRKLWLNSE